MPQYNRGLTLQEALASLRVFAASPRSAGLIITEYNPDHGDEEGALAATVVQGLAQALHPAEP